MSAAGRQAFIDRIAQHIDWGWATRKTSMEIAEAIVAKLPTPIPNYSTVKLLLIDCNWKPVCWICDLRIYLDEMEDDYARLSQDHVVPKSDGGTKLNGNIKLAHAICNATRHYSRVKPRTQTKIEAMKERLRARMAREMQDQVA